MIMTKILTDELSREDKLSETVNVVKQGKIYLKDNAE